VIAAAATAITMATTVKVPRARSRWPAAAALVVVLALLYTGAAAWQQWWPFAEPSRPAPAKKDWILVAEFDGPPGDSTLAPAARSLLSAALDQSRLLATVPQDQIREALKAAGKPGNTRVDAEVAKELAYRSAVRAVLEGEMGRIGHGYSLVVRVVDADTSRVLVTERATAKDEDALIPTLGELAKQLRKGLGENQQALKATRAMGLVATPSFEAYKLYLQAQTVFRRETAIRKAMGLYRAALALDPDFAAAWAVLGYRYGDLGYPDSELVCIEEALRRPDRLSAGQRGILAIARARAEGDFAGAAAALDRMVAEDPTNLQALGSGTDALWAMGRFEEAFERNRRAMQLSPFGPSEAMRVNDTVNSILLGRFDEAREANRHQTGIGKGALRAQIELAASQPAAAESMSLASLDDPRLKGDYPEGFRGMLGVAQFARGAVAAANQALERAEAMCRDASDPAGAAFWHRWRIDYSALSNGTMPMPRDGRARDTTAATLLDRGLEAAITRDLTLARRCLEQARGRPRRELVRQGAAPSLLEARLETMEGRPADAVRLLRPLAVKRVEVGWPNGVGLTWVRWYLADAFERLDQPDSAATYLERSWDLPFVWLACAEKPWVHRRLALLYARMGRIPDAERHLAALERAWDRPDPKVLTVLDEVRVAVKSARGMAAPVR
jgi:tetratricopeptide (TPR) repeat protein